MATGPDPVTVPALLISVRSAGEARAALEGGAGIIDVKEPDRGPLGRADGDVWRAVRDVVPARVPVSVALGELREWVGLDAPGPPPAGAFAGIAFRKVGLAGAGRDWLDDWARLRAAWGPGPPWIAVAYADWQRAEAPSPDAVLAAALDIPECAGVLVDTWDKARPAAFLEDPAWASWIAGARRGGRLVALAGGLDERAIGLLAPLAPDLFAARGAACAGGDRRGPMDPERVARLARAVRSGLRARGVGR